MSKLTSCCSLQFGETNPGSLFQSFGGVGRNLAGAFLHHYIICALRHPRPKILPPAFFQDSLSRLGQRPLLISATGADPGSDAVFKHCKHMVSQQQHREIILFRYVNLRFSHSVRTWMVWPGYSSRAQLPIAPLWLRVEK